MSDRFRAFFASELMTGFAPTPAHGCLVGHGGSTDVKIVSTNYCVIQEIAIVASRMSDVDIIALTTISHTK